MLSAYDILNMTQNREESDLNQMNSYYGQQIRQKYTLGGGMEGGFGANESATLRNETDQAMSDIRQNYNIKRQIIAERERQAKEEQDRKNRAGLLKNVGGIVKGASSYIPGVGGFIGGVVGEGLTQAGNVVGGDNIDIDWEDLGNRYKKMRRKV